MDSGTVMAGVVDTGKAVQGSDTLNQMHLI